LAATFALATGLAIGVLVYEGFRAADALRNEELQRRAAEIAHYVVNSPGEGPRLDLPPALDQVYRGEATYLFALRQQNGQGIAASSSEVARQFSNTPQDSADPRYFRLERFGSTGEDYYGLTVRAESPVGPVSVTIARASDADAVTHALLDQFVRRVVWVTPLFAAVTLAIAVWSIRRGLRPVLQVSERAAAITPDSMTIRLPTDTLPTAGCAIGRGRQSGVRSPRGRLCRAATIRRQRRP
jgi:hypothetical protein